jgi:hypothetical protein
MLQNSNNDGQNKYFSTKSVFGRLIDDSERQLRIIMLIDMLNISSAKIICLVWFFCCLEK